MYAKNHPIGEVAQVVSQDDMRHLLESIVKRFKHFIEEQRGWSLLFNDNGNEKPEAAAQLLFLGMAQPYLRQFNVELDREVELGRGPVDFKLSSGSATRMLLEVKKAHNGKFWNGIEAQLPSYMKSDDAREGWYLAIRYRDTKASEARMRELPDVIAKVANETGRQLGYFEIDARPKESASKL